MGVCGFYLYDSGQGLEAGSREHINEPAGVDFLDKLSDYKICSKSFFFSTSRWSDISPGGEVAGEWRW
jgi:hypothetical protein